MTERMLVVWLPDWPITAAGIEETTPAVIVDSKLVHACSRAARDLGVRKRQRLREAQSLCPELVVEARDDIRESRFFEPVIDAITEVSPRTEILRPGLCATPTLGASRYFGGESALIDHIHDVLTGVGVAASIGIADGRFAAVIAARRGRIVAPGTTPRFLHDEPIDEIDQPELVSIFRRLGVKTLGDLAALPVGRISDRFGPDGRRAHALASGLDVAPLQTHSGKVDLEVVREIDPPASLVDQVTFAGKSAADELSTLLSRQGISCALLSIELETENQLHKRSWRHQHFFDAASMVDRLRWQLSGRTVSSPVTKLRLIAAEVVPGSGMQHEFWGGESEADTRAGRALARVQTMLGFEAVSMPRLVGGRDHTAQVRLVPWGERRDTFETDGPWPGRLPAPAPANVNPYPVRIEVLDGSSRAVVVNKRGMTTGDPYWLVTSERRERITGWSAPWLFDERWWDADARRCVRMQLLTEDGTALLALFEGGQWRIEATYD